MNRGRGAQPGERAGIARARLRSIEGVGLMMRWIASLKIAAVCCCFLALAACSKKATNLEAGIGALPGSEQEFATVVGDRVYFIVDQSSLTPEAQETLRRQAAWLKKYGDVAVQVEGHAD